MDKKPCPICTRLNEPQETHCWYCHAELPSEPAEKPQLPDWLDGLQQDPGAGSVKRSIPPLESTESLEPGKSDEYVPDWLSRIRTREATERAEKKAEEDKYWAKKQSNSGVPDWLHSLNEDAAEEKSNNVGRSESSAIKIEPDESQIEEPSISSSGGEDWLESLKSWQPVDEAGNLTHPENPDSHEQSSDGGNTPQFDPQELLDILPEPEIDLQKIFSPAGSESEREPEKYSEPSGVVLPEGFQPLENAFNETENLVPANQTEPDVPAESSIDDGNVEVETDNEKLATLPFESFNNQLPEEDVALTQEPNINIGNDQPSYSEDLIIPIEHPEVVQSQPDIEDEHGEIIEDISADNVLIETSINPFKTDDLLLEPFKPDDLPEWLTDVKPIEKKPLNVKPRSEREPEAEGSPKPEKGNLPVWLAAQRPLEAVELAAIPTERNQESISSDGDQSASVMTGISAASFVGKPSDLGGGLKVSSRQKTNAALLSAIATNTELPEDSEKSSSTGLKISLWRLMLALVFFVVALLGGTVLNGYGIQPALYPGEIVNAFDRINSIAADKPVLIAGDFESGFAGEIRLTSQALIEHIMRRNLNIALMSINPVDSALLAYQIERGLTFVPSYQVIGKVVDLGYFPGGAIAVQDLANSFSYTVPLTADLVATSSHEILKNIQNMSDFGAIIVITDKAETARVWIEQLQPALGNTPLVMVTSAQASPLIQPYYQSGQVSGMVSGMSGGLVYERIIGANGEAGRNYTSLQLLSVLMAAIVLGGGFFSLVKPVSTGGKHQ